MQPPEWYIASAAAAAIKRTLEFEPPYGAKVTFSQVGASAGWDAPELAPWLEQCLHEASRNHFGKPVMFMGGGGSMLCVADVLAAHARQGRTNGA